MLPTQVRKQVEQAEEIAARLSVVPTDPANPDDPVVTDVVDTPPVVEPAAPATPAEPVQTEFEFEQPQDSWETKYKVLQGKYSAEVPRLHGQLREMQAHIDRMQGAMEVLQAAPAAKQAPEAPANTKPISTVKPEEVDEYGADFIDMVERAALQRVTPQIEALQNTVRNLMAQLSGQVNTVVQKQAQTEEQKFFARVGEAVPNWQEINVDPQWLAYLNELDPMTGIARQVYLNDARQNLDAGRVVNIFKAFTGNTTVSEPDATPAPKRSDALAKQLQPGRSKAAPTPSGGVVASVTTSDITKLYSDYRKGLYKGKEAEFKRKEIELLDAINAGKLR